MTRTRKLTTTALIAALCVLCLAGSVVLPRITLSLAALAGLFPAVTVMACGYAWAAGGAAVAALLALLLLPDKTAGVWFVCFFGHYPIWKALFEALGMKQSKQWLAWTLKLLSFAASMLLLYVLFGNLFAAAIPYDYTQSGAGPYLLVAALLAAFVAYDYAFSVLIGYFQTRVLPRIR